MLANAPLSNVGRTVLRGTSSPRLNSGARVSAMRVRPVVSAPRLRVVCSAAAAGGGAAEDPYKVLKGAAWEASSLPGR